MLHFEFSLKALVEICRQGTLARCEDPDEILRNSAFHQTQWPGNFQGLSGIFSMYPKSDGRTHQYKELKGYEGDIGC